MDDTAFTAATASAPTAPVATNTEEDGPKSKRELPEGAVATLRAWLLSPEHITHPYPTPQDQALLMQKTGIDKKQLKNWFANARRRIWKPLLKKQLEQGQLQLPTMGAAGGGGVGLAAIQHGGAGTGGDAAAAAALAAAWAKSSADDPNKTSMATGASKALLELVGDGVDISRSGVINSLGTVYDSKEKVINHVASSKVGQSMATFNEKSEKDKLASISESMRTVQRRFNLDGTPIGVTTVALPTSLADNAKPWPRTDAKLAASGASAAVNRGQDTAGRYTSNGCTQKAFALKKELDAGGYRYSDIGGTYMSNLDVMARDGKSNEFRTECEDRVLDLYLEHSTDGAEISKMSRDLALHTCLKKMYRSKGCVELLEARASKRALRSTRLEDAGL